MPKLTPREKADIISQDLTDLLLKWNEEGVVKIKEIILVPGIVASIKGGITIAIATAEMTAAITAMQQK